MYRACVWLRAAACNAACADGRRRSCSPPPSLLRPPTTPLCACAPQLLRGLATGMKVQGFSSASQWRPYAAEAAKQLKGVPLPASLSAHIYALGG